MKKVNSGSEMEFSVILKLSENDMGDCKFPSHIKAVNDKYKMCVLNIVDKDSQIYYNESVKDIINIVAEQKKWNEMIGMQIEKISGKPFKSGLRSDYVISIDINPNTNKKAFRMRMCNSLVDCHMCRIK